MFTSLKMLFNREYRGFRKLAKIAMMKDSYYISFMQHQEERPILQFEDFTEFKDIMLADNLKAMLIFNANLDVCYSVTNNKGLITVQKTKYSEVREYIEGSN